MTVAYDGTDFAGFAPNVGQRTVGGDLEAALSKVLREPIALTCAGRTDRGVHAWGQVVSFDTTSSTFEPARLCRSVRGLCGPAIAVRDVAAVPHTFDARFSAAWRRYRYTIVNDDMAAPPDSRYVWVVPDPLDLAAMEQGAIAIIGPHDFSSFCRRPPPRRDGTAVSLERTVLDATWSSTLTAGGQRRLVFDIRAPAFCHQMVRSIVGLLVDIGVGRRRASDVVSVLRALDRSVHSSLAPSRGLCLWEVGYPDEL